MDKLKIDRLIIVEGKYDKIRLSNIVDADIISVNGFSVFKDNELKKTIKNLAAEKGVLILTDSDTAGYKIRVYLQKILNGCDIANAFAPEIKGKEKRKQQPSASGFVGIEGTDDNLLKNVLLEYAKDSRTDAQITFSDLYELGYLGTSGASRRKNKLLEFLGVQKNISNTFLLRILNRKMTREEFYDLTDDEV